MKAICQHGSLTFNILNQFIKLQEKVGGKTGTFLFTKLLLFSMSGQ